MTDPVQARNADSKAFDLAEQRAGGDHKHLHQVMAVGKAGTPRVADVGFFLVTLCKIRAAVLARHPAKTRRKARFCFLFRILETPR